MLAVFQAACTRRSVKICFCLLLHGAIRCPGVRAAVNI